MAIKYQDEYIYFKVSMASISQVLLFAALTRWMRWLKMGASPLIMTLCGIYFADVKFLAQDFGNL